MALTRKDVERSWLSDLDRSFGDWPFRPLEAWRRMMGESDIHVEEFIENDQVVVRAELPGVDPERDVDISIVDGNLVIRGERRQEERAEDRDYRHSEIRYGSFSRTLPLPSGTREDDISATYTDGVLEVRAPVAAAPRPTRVPINRGPGREPTEGGA